MPPIWHDVHCWKGEPHYKPNKRHFLQLSDQKEINAHCYVAIKSFLNVNHSDIKMIWCMYTEGPSNKITKEEWGSLLCFNHDHWFKINGQNSKLQWPLEYELYGFGTNVIATNQRRMWTIFKNSNHFYYIFLMYWTVTIDCLIFECFKCSINVTNESVTDQEP